ncbi:helix-turn-helix transcriptional regulator [Lacisediminihabitans profunda]|uniref:Helix-turn-helix domain-containing protein n=1 Tax=Lacisediminihabitans profunda TaxID=2594790 RepID=A0A5C8UKY7_9MICO|nr:helix-turn-helix transcriptional regulator [Lacisediminihabitans profunda]TXN28945.1 helix-turn-helix domain-containing protein [Lacisediminihabitans profunda]
MHTLTGNALGEFLRASRGNLDPEEAGLAGGRGTRRVAGLRREEVAVLAGVSADYYARLEQGRERSPSSQVLDAIARALRLDRDSRGHLYRLAGMNPSLRAGSSRDLVDPALLTLLDSFPAAAAYVLGPSFDILATNSAAAALLAPFAQPGADGPLNMVRVLFLHPDAKSVFIEWDSVTRATVHALRLNAGYDPNNPAIMALLDELLPVDAFRTLWNDQTVTGLARAYKVFVHPSVGRIELTYQTFEVRDAPGQQLLVGTPAIGSSSADALALLGTLHATATRDIHA